MGWLGKQMESKKNLVGLAAHPTNPLLLFTFAAEGLLTCHACNVATRSLSPVWALPLEGTKGGVTQVGPPSFPFRRRGTTSECGLRVAGSGKMENERSGCLKRHSQLARGGCFRKWRSGG